MTTTLGSPYTPPDDIMLDISTTSGAVQLKAQTRGDLIRAGVDGVMAPLALGTNGQYLKSDGTDAAWGPAPGEGWTILETITPAAATTITSSALPVYDEYMITFHLKGSVANANLNMRINGVTSAGAYTYAHFSGSTYTYVSSATTAIVGYVISSTNVEGMIRIAGKTVALAGAALGFSCLPNGHPSIGGAVSGAFNGGNAVQVSTITLFPGSGNITGKVEIYGRNFS